MKPKVVAVVRSTDVADVLLTWTLNATDAPGTTMAGLGGVVHASAGLGANVILIVPVAVPVALVMVTTHVPVVFDERRSNEMRPAASITFGLPPTTVPPMVVPTVTFNPCATWFPKAS